MGKAEIGKWEVVDPSQDYFKVNSVKNVEGEGEQEAKPKRKFITFSNSLANVLSIGLVPEGEIVGELHSDVDKYESPEHAKQSDKSK